MNNFNSTNSTSKESSLDHSDYSFETDSNGSNALSIDLESCNQKENENITMSDEDIPKFDDIFNNYDYCYLNRDPITEQNEQIEFEENFSELEYFTNKNNISIESNSNERNDILLNNLVKEDVKKLSPLNILALVAEFEEERLKKKKNNNL
ncbi:hypothetical protein TUBRATIS_29120 [Tubulinosema ratisbonensis]|uniref:Uncharacterized protein n=1 Tax=Tubulinosema ratisbonensis TaxID=291195 RepID=A0A437AHW1_9MICR|nr:hypothetical protein TUBRATIS_29120 [Tubulinosema ratisbonensis]